MELTATAEHLRPHRDRRESGTRMHARVGDATSTRVVLIDDDKFAYDFVCADLSEANGARFDIAWKATWEEGREALLSHGFDVALLDYQLGERSGVELLQEVIAAGCR